MCKWLRKRGKLPVPNPGTALSGILKGPWSTTYSAQTGYVYQYVFQVLSQVQPMTAERLPFSSPERYALDKMTFFQAFEEQEDTGRLAVPFAITTGIMKETLHALGRIE